MAQQPTDITNAPKQGMGAIEADMRTRWLPSAEQMAAAAAMITALGYKVTAVAVGIALPGKPHHSWWEDGQAVEHAAGFWPVHHAHTDGPYSYRAGGDAAEAAALAQLGDRPGCVSIATIEIVGGEPHAYVWPGHTCRHAA